MRLIDADELIAFIKFNGYVYANALEKFPTVDAVPVVHGEWINTSTDEWNKSYYCSACNSYPAYSHMRSYWCPNCGAKMTMK